jgi:hypothetical protein
MTRKRLGGKALLVPLLAILFDINLEERGGGGGGVW